MLSGYQAVNRCKYKSNSRKEKGKSQGSDVQVSLVHVEAMLAAFSCSSLSESGGFRRFLRDLYTKASLSVGLPAHVRLVRLQRCNANACTGPMTGPIRAKQPKNARTGPPTGPVRALVCGPRISDSQVINYQLIIDNKSADLPISLGVCGFFVYRSTDIRN